MTQIKFQPFPELQTDRLILRAISPRDENEIFMLRSDEKIGEFLGRPLENSIEQARDFINKRIDDIANDKSVYWAITLKTSDTLIGTICLWNFSEEDAKADIGYELLPQFQKKGLMQEAFEAVVKFAFTKLQLRTIEAFVQKENVSSVKILEKNNFELQERTEGNEVMYALSASH